MVKANVWANVKAIMDIAIVTIKILALPDQTDHLELPVPTENLAQMVLKDRQDQLEPPLNGITMKPQVVVKNAQMDPKDPTDLPVQLEQPVRKAVPAAKVVTANPADPAQLVQLAVQAQPAAMVIQDLAVKKERMRPRAPKVLPDLLVKKAALVQEETKEAQEQRAKPVLQAQPVQLVPLAVQAKMAKMEEKVRLAHLEDQAQMPNTARAPIVPRKHKQSQHWINPNTILGQHRFDHDNQYFQLSLKLIVSMMICIYNWVELFKQFT